MKYINLYILSICSVFLLSSCALQTNNSKHTSPDVTGDEKELALQSIIILPTEHGLISNKSNAAEVNALDKGAHTLTDLLGAYFIDNPTINLLSSIQADSYLGSYIGGSQLKEAKHIGMQAGADAILISQIYRFRELDGKKYGANEPASVSFDYQLIHLKSGIVLCKGTYDETQQTLLSNLFNFGKASKRKFKFVKGGELLKEGIKEKFSQCSHLNQ